MLWEKQVKPRDRDFNIPLLTVDRTFKYKGEKRKKQENKQTNQPEFEAQSPGLRY